MNNYVLYVHSEYEYIVRAFKFVAYMFGSDGNYKGLIWAIGAAAILFGAFMAVSRQSTSGKGGILAWGIGFIFAAVIIISVTTSKANIVIHDVTTNRFTEVGGIPTIMAVLAYGENSIETDLKELIEDVMQPIIDYDTIGRGKGFELLASFDEVGKAYFAKYPYIQASVGSYWKQCVVPDMAQGWIDSDNIFKATDMWQSIKSETATRFSTIYTNNSQSQLSCKAAWEEINKSLKDSDMQEGLSSKCEKDRGSEALAIDACKTSLSSIVETTVSPGATMNSFIRSYLIAYILASNEGMLVEALTDMNRRNASSAFMAEKTLPRLKGMMYGLMIGIFPFLIAFLWVNPVKTAAFYLGMYILMILWTAIDTFMDMQYQSEVVNMYVQMRTQGLGFQQMFDIPNIAADAVSLYGQGRWMSLGLATAIASAITGINNYALSHMGGQLSATAQGAAASASQFAGTAGQEKLAEQAGSELARRGIMSSYSLANIALSTADYNAQHTMSNMQTGSGMSEIFGGNLAASKFMSGKTLGHASGEFAKYQALGFDNMQSYSHWKSSDGLITQNMAESLSLHGLNPATANAMVGKKLESLGLNPDGTVSNIKASGVGSDGRDWNISEAGIKAQYIAGEGINLGSGIYVPSGANITENYSPNGSLAQVSVEGGGYRRFSRNMETGYTYGSYTYSKGGIEYTETYNGNTRDIKYMNADGNIISSRQILDSSTGNYASETTNITVGRNGYNLGGIRMQEGSAVTIGAGGITTGNGVFKIGNNEYSGIITTNSSGMILNYEGKSGHNLNRQNIEDYNYSRQNKSEIGASESYQGQVLINGQVGSGELRKIGDQTIFTGTLNGKSVTQIYDGSEIYSPDGKLASLNGGTQIFTDAKSGNTESVYKNDLQIKDGGNITLGNTLLAGLMNGDTDAWNNVMPYLANNDMRDNVFGQIKQFAGNTLGISEGKGVASSAGGNVNGSLNYKYSKTYNSADTKTEQASNQNSKTDSKGTSIIDSITKASTSHMDSQRSSEGTNIAHTNSAGSSHSFEASANLNGKYGVNADHRKSVDMLINRLNNAYNTTVSNADTRVQAADMAKAVTDWRNSISDIGNHGNVANTIGETWEIAKGTAKDGMDLLNRGIDYGKGLFNAGVNKVKGFLGKE